MAPPVCSGIHGLPYGAILHFHVSSRECICFRDVFLLPTLFIREEHHQKNCSESDRFFPRQDHARPIDVVQTQCILFTSEIHTDVRSHHPSHPVTFPIGIQSYLLRRYLDPPGTYITVSPITFSEGTWIPKNLWGSLLIRRTLHHLHVPARTPGQPRHG